MNIRNKELIDRKFDQIDGKIRHLHHLLNGKSTTQDFKKGLEEMSGLNMEIRSMIERDTTPLRRG